MSVPPGRDLRGRGRARAARLLERPERLIFAGSIDPALRPVIAIKLLATSAASMLFTYVSIWAIERLHSGQTMLGAAWMVSAIAGFASGYLGGHLSDRVGRRRIVLLAHGATAIQGLLYLAAGGSAWLGLSAFVLAGVVHQASSGADDALIADLVPPEGRPEAYAATRVAQNLGAAIGPAVGGIILHVGWNGFFAASAALSALSFLVAYRLLPAKGRFTPEKAPERSSLAVIGADAGFRWLLIAGSLAFVVYTAYETLLPVSATQTHHLSKSLWGILLVINPLAVTFFQVRLSRRTAALPPFRVMAAALGCMGLPFLLLQLSGSPAVVALILVVFVIGEMLWVPTVMAAVSTMAPEDVRGAYLGAYGATSAVGFALGPIGGFALREQFGDGVMWTAVAAVAIVAVVVFGIAFDRIGRRLPQEALA